MFKGTIYMTSDINIVNNSIANCKVLMVTNEPLLEGHPNRVGATILLPPTQAIIADADDDMMTFQNLYYQYLISDEVTEFITLLFYILNKGVNILMYIPKEDVKSLDYVGFLLAFFMNNYGIQIGTDQAQFSFNPQFEGIVGDMLYLNELIDYDELLMGFNVALLNDATIVKMYNRISPYMLGKPTIMQMREYFIRYQQDIFKRNKFLEPVVSRKGDE